MHPSHDNHDAANLDVIRGVYLPYSAPEMP
jgi:hypothetical protein